MTFLSTISLLALVLVDDNLCAAALFLDFSLDNGSLDVWRPDLDIFVISDKQDLVKLNGLADFLPLQEFVLEDQAIVYAILFATGFNHCIHVLNTPIRARF